MAQVIIADDGITFDGTTSRFQPLGGAESAVVALAEALAKRGHRVQVYNKCDAPLHHKGVDWVPIGDGLPQSCDLYIANRGHKLIPCVPAAGKRLFWTHNPCRYLLKRRYLWALWRWRPTIILIGDYHAGTLPKWVPEGGRKIIPLGVSDVFLRAEPASSPPPPRAIFTSNPLRSLDWLLEVWERYVAPEAPQAELRIFSGSKTYGSIGNTKAEQMATVLQKARDMAHLGVQVYEPVARSRLVDELGQARLMAYRGDPGETFCLAVAEAQAMGVPAVVQDVGSLAERVIDGETGTIAADGPRFGAAIVRLLRDDAHWRRQHRACLEKQRHWSWDDVARQYEELLD